MMQVYEEMITTDKSLKLWKNYIGVICAHFDRQKMYYSLYETQIWMNDHIRAAITCTYFYTNKTRNYQDLNSNLKYLDLSTSHLLAALKSTPGYERKDLVMNLKKEEIIQHLSTIKLQIEVTQFLASRCLETSMATVPPTLFGSNEQRSRVAIMILICGENLCQSLLLANRIIDEWNLDKYLIFCKVGEKFVEKDQIADMRKLVDMLGNEVLSNKVILSILRKQPSKLDDLIYLINDVSMKITAYIECGQLKSAYLLAVQSKLLNFIPKILQASELLNQPLIKKICLQLLYQLDDKQT
uniref:ZFYVE26-like TPR repeats domain-containing protein n=3 Tax=Clastoptera arizonana TaxID=38151 RepID=A0A1B6E2P3_9HEMI